MSLTAAPAGFADPAARALPVLAPAPDPTPVPTPTPTPTPAIYDTTIRHVRVDPVRNAFTYRSYTWLVDLDALPRFPAAVRPLARFEAADHLGDPGRTIRENVDAFLATHGVDLAGGRVLMLGHARVLGHVFNPLSVFWCHDAGGRLACVIAEVHNTYGQRHAYLLKTDDRGRAQVDKAFYVSPFEPVAGSYRMSLPEPGEDLDVTITLHRPGGAPFVARLTGRRRAGTTGALLRTAARRPMAPLLDAVRIRRQGIALWLRGMRPQPRPEHHQEGVS